MELHTLKPAKGAVKSGRRRGRGQGSGQGGTASRGHKGQKSRSGYSRKRNFEGGQMPLQMRLPKRGFKSPNRTEYVKINLDQLQAFADKHNSSEVTLELLKSHRYIAKRDLVKILGRGELTSAVSVEVHAISETARKAIEEKGGKITLV
ncbi:MAG: 50S ribosomal protein L15 [Bacteroidetes bacterium]|nr:MAG: 50S ribosomal protein L15 [Bacteroidota bacterium]